MFIVHVLILAATIAAVGTRLSVCVYRGGGGGVAGGGNSKNSTMHYWPCKNRKKVKIFPSVREKVLQ